MTLVVAVKKEKTTESGAVVKTEKTDAPVNVEDPLAEPEPDSDESSPFDPQLDEAVSILNDYVEVLKTGLIGETVVQKK